MIEQFIQIVEPLTLAVIVSYASYAVAGAQHLPHVERIAAGFRVYNEAQGGNFFWGPAQSRRGILYYFLFI